MTRHYNTKHQRSRSTYSKKGKGSRADKYGTYDSNGRQISADKLAKDVETPEQSLLRAIYEKEEKP